MGTNRQTTLSGLTIKPCLSTESYWQSFDFNSVIANKMKRSLIRDDLTVFTTSCKNGS